MWDTLARRPDTVCAHEVPDFSIIIIKFQS